MAGYIKGITIEFGANTTKLNKALSNVNGKLNKTQAELKQVNRSLKFNPGNTALLNQKFKLLQQTVKQTEKKLQGLKAMQQRMKAQGIDENSAQYRELQREIVKTENNLKQAEAELKRRYDAARFEAERAKQIGDWPRAAREFRRLCDMIPYADDPRHAEANANLVDVEKRLEFTRKKGGRR